MKRGRIIAIIKCYDGSTQKIYQNDDVIIVSKEEGDKIIPLDEKWDKNPILQITIPLYDLKKESTQC